MIRTDEFRQHLNERRAQRYASSRFWNRDPHEIGMEGERELAEFFGGIQDFRNRPGGDDRIDLEVLLNLEGPDSWFEIDVKTANDPKYLLVNVEKIVPHRIYVLCGPKVHGWRLLGWERGSAMMREPISPWCGNDAIVHYKKRHLLQKMNVLKMAYRGWWRHHGRRARPAIGIEVEGVKRAVP
jgi:hypothetical protein